MHSLPTRYLIGVIVVVAAILYVAWFYNGGKAFGRVSPVCYGFVIGYSVAFIHSRLKGKGAKI
jgi:hypothetical protein